MYRLAMMPALTTEVLWPVHDVLKENGSVRWLWPDVNEVINIGHKLNYPRDLELKSSNVPKIRIASIS